MSNKPKMTKDTTPEDFTLSLAYYAYPDEGFRFVGWYENGEKVSEEETWIDEYGASRIL